MLFRSAPLADRERRCLRERERLPPLERLERERERLRFEGERRLDHEAKLANRLQTA